MGLRVRLVVLVVVVRLGAHRCHWHLMIHRVVVVAVGLPTVAVYVFVPMTILWLVFDLYVTFAVFLTRISLEASITGVSYHRVFSSIVTDAAGGRDCGAVEGVFLFVSSEMGGQLVFVDPAAARPSQGCRLRHLIRVWTTNHLDVVWR